MVSRFLVFALGCILLLAPSVGFAQEPFGEGAWDEKAKEHRVKTTLLLDHSEVRPGDSVRVGVWYELDPDWHIYWRNSGEAGLATKISWRLQHAKETKPWFEGADKVWPAPHVYRQSAGVITTYGYGDAVLLWTTVRVPQGLKPGQTTVWAKTDFLTCKVECIPGTIEMRLPLKVGEKTTLANQARFGAWVKQVPTPTSKAKVRLSQNKVRSGDRLEAEVVIELCDTPGCGLKPESNPKAIDAFIPDLAPQLTWTPVSLSHDQATGKTKVRLKGKVSANKLPESTRLAGVLRLSNKRSLWFESKIATAPKTEDLVLTPLSGASIAPPGQEGVISEGQKSPAKKEPVMSFWYALLSAFIGGLILNVMPCVLPVLSLKLAGLSQVASKGHREVFGHGLAYTAGIMSAMGVLALVVIGVKVAGMEVGWGFQFQNPYFLTALCAALVIFALNLFGVFEFGLVAGADQVTQMADEASGGRQSFLEGVLCVLLSTPCSAPFMGAAVGFALASSWWTILGVFMMLGLGLATPFLVLTAIPAWTVLIPKPGPWLERVKQFLGFSLFGTVVWLLWIVGQGWGGDGQSRVLGVMLVVGLCCWVWGMNQYGSAVKKGVTLAVVSGVLMGVSWVVLAFDDAPTQEMIEEQGEFAWQVFDESRIAKELEQGHPVFVDFTADWCITCKVNERTVLVDPEVQEAIRAHGVKMYKADWTKRDEKIRRILKRHGKGGVPMYLVYSPQKPTTPKVLPELLTAGLVRDALAESAKAR